MKVRDSPKRPGQLEPRQHRDECAQRGADVSLEGARKALAGNLCRCTGYGKILTSALAAAEADE